MPLEESLWKSLKDDVFVREKIITINIYSWSLINKPLRTPADIILPLCAVGSKITYLDDKKDFSFHYSQAEISKRSTRGTFLPCTYRSGVQMSPYMLGGLFTRLIVQIWNWKLLLFSSPLFTSPPLLRAAAVSENGSMASKSSQRHAAAVF